MLCNTCTEKDSCVEMCSRLKMYLIDEDVKALTNSELQDYAIYVLSKSGMTIMQIIRATALISNMSKSLIYRDINSFLAHGEALVDYFLNNKHLSFDEIHTDTEGLDKIYWEKYLDNMNNYVNKYSTD